MKPFGVRRLGRGMALPVILIFLAVMLVTSIYMLRATHSTVLTTGNLAYDTVMSRATDYGLHAAFQVLSAQASADKTKLYNTNAAIGYEAKLDTTLDVHDAAFWTNGVTITDPDNNQIDYVIHRLCKFEGAYDANNVCMQTAATSASLGNTVPLGSSLAADAPQFASQPQLHYVITARIHGARGGNVINQFIVLIGT